MPAIVISAVNTGTEELTAVAHGLLTGDRFRLRNVGGALPAATPALAPRTDYFAVRTGADTLKVSDTNAHALAGTGIVNLTGSGTGTHIVEYGLPYCVPRIAAAGTQVFHDDDNAAWGALVASYDGTNKRAPWPRTFWAKPGAGFTQFSTSGSNGPVLQSISGAGGVADIPYDDGDRIIGVSYEVFGDGAVDSTILVYWNPGIVTANRVELGRLVTVNHPASVTLNTIIGPGGVGLFAPQVLTAGGNLYLDMQPSAANMQIGPIRALFDRI